MISYSSILYLLDRKRYKWKIFLSLSYYLIDIESEIQGLKIQDSSCK